MSNGQSPFDRAMSLIEMPDVISTQASTIMANNALLGHTGTHIVQTCREREDGFTIFLQIVDIGGLTQVVLPDKVCRAIYRQRQSLIDRGRRKTTPKALTSEERKKQRVREAKRILREAKKHK